MTSKEEQVQVDAHLSGNGGSTRGEFIRGAIVLGAAVGGGGLLDACGSSGSSSTTASSSTPSNATVRQGGSMTIGIASGSTADTLSPWASYTISDASRQFALYDSLMQIRGSTTELAPVPQLAEEMTPNKDGSEWTIRLRSGVEFHNGKTLDVNDFLYTAAQITNPKNGAFDFGRFILFDLKAAKKLDALTVRIPLLTPIAIMDQLMGGGSVANIVPVGFDIKAPVGTGPFKLKSFAPGQQTVLERFPNYWGEAAKLDTLTLVDMSDDTARYNALLSGQIDLMDTVPYAQVESLKANPNYHVSSLPTGLWLPIYMRVDLPPFNDVRVRQAMRLLIDRQQVIETAFFGNASYGNDVFGRFDPILDSSLHRTQDVEQAKSLLKQAGREGLTATLVTANIAPGAFESTQVFAQNAKAAGVNINLRQVDEGTMYGPNYLNWPFGVDNWPGLNYLVLNTTFDGPNAHVDLTHFSDPRFDSIFKQAVAELDPSKRADLAHELQMIEFTQGGAIIPAFPNYTAAYSTKVGGFYPANLTGGAVAAGFFNKLGFVA